ncbi:O-methyltransferase [Chryseomicrobium palamuruense]|uniref:O-methyltransferase n=1 Tax=Chryseomicrobium palamuruense TaxID=682973 RepID=A0ABV8UXK1_9BACL
MTSTDFQQLFSSQRTAFFHDMERFATEHHVPIMRPDGMDALVHLLHLQNAETVLEVGSAIGYSALRMAASYPSRFISTIERDEDRYKQAEQFIQSSDHSHQIELFHADALDFPLEKLKLASYDALFIDAAKGQYQLFFDRYAPLVKSGGVIYSDNIYLNGLSQLPMSEVPRRKRTMVRKLHEFAEALHDNSEYDSQFYPIGDGLLVSKKR